MTGNCAAILAATRLESVVQDFLDARLSGQRDLLVGGEGVTLSVFRGNAPANPWRTSWGYWGFAGGTLLNAFRVLQALDVSTHRGFWMPASGKQFNWHIQESKNS